jgi:hypothetical protein
MRSVAQMKLVYVSTVDKLKDIEKPQAAVSVAMFVEEFGIVKQIVSHDTLCCSVSVTIKNVSFILNYHVFLHY